MQHSALAQQFEDVSSGLRAGGHGIIMRKARALLERGDTDAALAFLEKAGTRMRSDELAALGGAVSSWAQAGGDAAALAAEPTWIASRAREDRGARLIDEVVSSGESLNDMVDALALEQMALGENEPLASLPPMPARVEVEPAVDETPVEPAVDETPVEPAVADEAPVAAIEKPADLEARPADFDAPAEPEAPEEPAVAAEPELPDEPAIDETPAEPEVPEEPAVAAEPEAPEEPAVAAEPETPVEPEAPADFGKSESAPVVTSANLPADESSGGSGIVLMLVAIIGLAAAAWYFLK